MKVFQKLLVCFALQIMAISLVAKEKDVSSNIGIYFLKKSQLAHSKTFVNNDSSKTFVLAWELEVPNTNIVYSQNTIITPGSSCVLDIDKAEQYLKTKLGRSVAHYELSLSLGVVTKAPIRPHMDFESRALKGAEKGFRIIKKDFLKHNVFKLEKNKKGKLLYKAIS